MRRLPVVLFSVVAVVPAVALMAMSSDAGATTRSVVGTRAAAVSPSTPAGPTPAGPTPARPKLAAATRTTPEPVAAKIVERALTGVEAAGTELTTSNSTVLTRTLSTAAFQTLGVTWAATPREPDLLISVRTHQSNCQGCAPADANGWSAWNDLDDDAGDDGTARAAGVRGGTDPLWVGRSDGVQVMIVVRSGVLPKDLKLALVDPGRSDYDATAASTRPAGALSAASVGKPGILSRAAWGADERKVRNAPTYMATIKATVLHHTAGPNHYSPGQVPSIIRGDYAYHLSRGWSDIGYNALIDRFGRIWEGRAGGLDRAVMGAHAGGFNTDTFGVAVIGNLDVSRPTAATITAITRVMAWKLDLNHRAPLGATRLTSSGGGTARYKAGRTITFPVIMGHRNTGFTACPGRYLYPYLPSIRTRVKGLIRAELTNPTPPAASVPQGRPLTISARSLAAQSWRLDVTAPCGGGRVARIQGRAKAGHVITARWNGRLANGSLARPGRYTLTLTSRSSAATARPLIYGSLVLPPAPVPVPTGIPLGGPGGYQPVTPTRVLDTRTAGRIGLGPHGRVDIPVLGLAGLPSSGVTAVVLNLTASCVSTETALSVWPTGSTESNRPVSDLPAGVTRSVLVTSRVGANGSVSVGNARGVTELTADVVGYYTPGGAPIRVINSTRLYDSRNDPAGKLVAGQARLIPLPATLDGIPSSQVKAVIVDVEGLNPAGAGTLTAFRPDSDGSLPSLSYRSGESVDNLAIAEVSNGAIVLQASGSPVDAILDLRGLVVDSALGGNTFTARRPVLILDTRASGGAIKAGAIRRVVVSGANTGVPAGASAVLIDLTGIAPAKDTTLQVYPYGPDPTGGVAVRVPAGDTRGNLVVVPVGPGGAIAVAVGSGSAQVRVDVHGYFQ